VRIIPSYNPVISLYPTLPQDLLTPGPSTMSKSLPYIAGGGSQGPVGLRTQFQVTRTPHSTSLHTPPGPAPL